MPKTTIAAADLPHFTPADIDSIAAAARQRRGADDPECPPMTDADIDTARRLHISLRLPEVDMAAIRVEARRLGIPYQTLIGSILHRFATGQLVDARKS
jgi:hypothetical protein